MKEKLNGILNSIRFWQVTVGMLFVLLGHYFPEMQFLWNTLAGYVATVVGIGTLDSVAKNISATKEEPQN